jgi:hypothetical protein
MIIAIPSFLTMTTVCASCASELPEESQACANCAAAAVATAPAHDPSPAPDIAPFTPSFNLHDDLEGLSGWLILVGIGLVIAPFRLLFAIFGTNLPFLLGSGNQEYLSSHPLTAALAGSEVLVNVLFFASMLALNYLFFKKKKGFPTYMILYHALNAILLSINHMAFQTLHPTADLSAGLRTAVGSVVGALIWIPYFLVSRRVKATFVH